MSEQPWGPGTPVTVYGTRWNEPNPAEPPPPGPTVFDPVLIGWGIPMHDDPRVPG